jgi:hypothetical protein
MYGVVLLDMSGVVLLASKALGTDMAEGTIAEVLKIYAETQESLVFPLMAEECSEQRRQGLRKIE